jgi:zinc protease
LKEIKHDGVDESVTQKVIEAQKREMEVKIKQNGYWMRALKYSYEYGYDPTDIINYNDRIDAITQQKLQRAAKEYINFDNYVYLRLLPEK